MTTFTLSARRDGFRTEYVRIHAETTSEATMDAMFKVLDRAMDSELWGKGEITLTCGDEVIQRMPGKP